MASANSRPSARGNKSKGTTRSHRIDDTTPATTTTTPTVDELREARNAYFARPASERIRSEDKSSNRNDEARKKHHTEPSRTLKRSGDKTRKDSSGLVKEKGQASKSKKGPSLREEYVYGSAARPGRNSQRDGSSQPGPSRHERAASSQPDHIRPKLQRSLSTSQAQQPTRPSLARRDTTGAAASKKDHDRKRSSVFGSLFRTSSTPVVKPKTVDCLTCGSDDVSITRSAKLKCGHRMCNSCLRRIFTMSVKDEAHMPPRCCTSDHIPLKYVDDLFDTKFKVTWNKKYQEYTTKHRIYCPIPGCGSWIKPSQIHTEAGRKQATCSKCKSKICIACSRKWHKRAQCPKDEASETLAAMAVEKGWRRCPNCSRMIEKTEGCNHMTCICTTEFCILCGSKWKSCDCPWFDYTQIQDGDRFMPNVVPQILRRHIFGPDVAEQHQQPQPHPAPNARANPALRYQQEMDTRRRQVLRDEALARRLALHDAVPPPAATAHAAANQQVFGTAGSHFLNETFVQQATNLVMDVLGTDPTAAAGYGRRGERESGRRRRPTLDAGDGGLAPNAFGTESLLGFAPPTPQRQQQQQQPRARRASLLRTASKNQSGDTGGAGAGAGTADASGGGDFIGRWLSRLG